MKNCGKSIYRAVCRPGDEILLCGAVRGVVKATALELEVPLLHTIYL